MVEQFVKRKGREEGLGDVEHHMLAARNISRPMELKDYISMRFVDAD